MNHIQRDIESLYKSHHLTTAQELSATLLTAEQRAFYENQVASFTEQLVATRFNPANPGELQAELLQFTYLQARRDTLVALLADSSEAYAKLAADPAPAN
jgi:hypothetical protein